MKTVLFQGDSITDANRSREDDTLMGSGYPTILSAKLMYEHPGQYNCVNRAVSGDRVVNILNRMRCDIEQLRPDVLSLLIGVNDVWHEIGHGNGVSGQRFERVLDLIIDELRQSLPETKILLLEPFVLEGSATCSTGSRPNRWDEFRREVPLRAAAVKRIAEKYQLPFIPLQAEFDRLATLYGSETWLRDGVHPTVAGHELIARAWFEQAKDLL